MAGHCDGVMSCRDLIKLIERDGWYLVRQKGTHKHFKHPRKVGLVTIPHKVTKNIEMSVKRQAGLRKAKK